ncbi:hypothetical protein [Streptomyces sp. 4F14]|uniref:hypothetical protein n=1 Tax=Streptomyces sp. 4F14 TaxID=3394380 RepID=UPI003A8A5429
MPRPPRRTARVLPPLLAATAVLALGDCSTGDDAQAEEVSAAPVAESSATPRITQRLTEAQAKAALVTATDLEDDWTQVTNAATWRDTLLLGKVDVAAFLAGWAGKADAADCQRLLDALYDDDLLGKVSGASAVTGFQEDDSRLYYQTAAYDSRALDTELAWLKQLPVTCAQFTVTGGSGGTRTVQVVENPLPAVGDARQGLRVTVQGQSNGAPATLTLDAAAVRVGPNAITLTNGGLDGIETDSTEQAVRLGAERLQDVLAGE